MAAVQFEFKGWQGFVAIAVLLAIVAVRFMTFSDMRSDTTLMQQLQIQLGLMTLANQLLLQILKRP